MMCMPGHVPQLPPAFLVVTESYSCKINTVFFVIWLQVLKLNFF